MANETSLLGRVKAMEVGDKIAISFAECGYSTIRNYATVLGLEDRKYSVHLDREARTYTIIRHS